MQAKITRAMREASLIAGREFARESRTNPSDPISLSTAYSYALGHMMAEGAAVERKLLDVINNLLDRVEMLEERLQEAGGDGLTIYEPEYLAQLRAERNKIDVTV